MTTKYLVREVTVYEVEVEDPKSDEIDIRDHVMDAFNTDPDKCRLISINSQTLMGKAPA